MALYCRYSKTESGLATAASFCFDDEKPDDYCDQYKLTVITVADNVTFDCISVFPEIEMRSGDADKIC